LGNFNEHKQKDRLAAGISKGEELILLFVDARGMDDAIVINRPTGVSSTI
jgi:hypothetical protein